MDAESESLIRAMMEEEGQGVQVFPHDHCPHLKDAELVFPSGAHLIASDARCSVCGEGEVWVCALCGAVLCSRFKNQHMAAHSQSEGHCVALSLSDLSFWCFQCDAYLDVFKIKALQPLYTAAHIAQFGEAPRLPGQGPPASAVAASSSSGAGAGSSSGGAAPTVHAIAPPTLMLEIRPPASSSSDAPAETPGGEPAPPE
mmetsp:Transcript_168173/g.535170  ORF Transcript_168173/g.535170 Transcript_168173/m.535170 type:complete len:200 (+) Transcript_168173:151-750(+)